MYAVMRILLSINVQCLRIITSPMKTFFFIYFIHLSFEVNGSHRPNSNLILYTYFNNCVRSHLKWFKYVNH